MSMLFKRTMKKASLLLAVCMAVSLLPDTAIATLAADVHTHKGIVVPAKDATWLDAENYTLVSGSTIVTLKPKYLTNLPVGKHDIAVVYDDKEAMAEFAVEPAPLMGGESLLNVWVFIAAPLAGGIIAALFWGYLRGTAKR